MNRTQFMEFSIDESPAARALGPLFKLTEVHLWDAGISDVREISHSPELNKFSCGIDGGNGGFAKSNAFSSLAEDVELVKELSDLGLPLSFRNNKEKRTGMVRGKRKGTRKINMQIPLEDDNSLLNIKVTEETVLKTSEMVDQYENLNHGIVIDVDSLSNLSLEREDSTSSTACTSAIDGSLRGKCMTIEAEAFQNTNEMVVTDLCIDDGSCLTNENADFDMRDMHGEIESAMDHEAEGQSNDRSFEVMQGEDGSAYPLFENAKPDMIVNHQAESPADWTAYWDDFHARTYFYNAKTEVSTWDPPAGMEHLVCEYVAAEPTERAIELTELDYNLFDSKKSDEVYRSEECINHNSSTSQEFDDIPANIIELTESDNNLFDSKKSDVVYRSEECINHNGSTSQEFDDIPANIIELTELDNNLFDSKKSDEVFRSEECINHNSSTSQEFDDIPANIIELTESDNNLFDSKKSDEVYRSEECINHNGSTSQEFDDIPENIIPENIISVDNLFSTSTTKRIKKVKRAKSKELSISCEDVEEVLLEVTPSISKYWCQRYILFSRFDQGIKMDEEGWFSVTPELISKHHAVRCGTGAIVDFFTGVGGNSIQFAQWSSHVVAIDIDPKKIEYARHNAAIYGVAEKIDFIKGDSFSLAPMLKADTVFMSPPWGGPNYSKVKKFDIDMLRPRDGQFLFNVGMGIASKIVMFLPRNVDINQLAELSLSATPPWSLEVEKNYLNGRLKAITAYFCKP